MMDLLLTAVFFFTELDFFLTDAFYDPDGTVVELVEQPFMDELFSVLKWVRSTFF